MRQLAGLLASHALASAGTDMSRGAVMHEVLRMSVCMGFKPPTPRCCVGERQGDAGDAGNHTGGCWGLYASFCVPSVCPLWKDRVERRCPGTWCDHSCLSSLLTSHACVICVTMLAGVACRVGGSLRRHLLWSYSLSLAAVIKAQVSKAGSCAQGPRTPGTV